MVIDFVDCCGSNRFLFISTLCASSASVSSSVLLFCFAHGFAYSVQYYFFVLRKLVTELQSGSYCYKYKLQVTVGFTVSDLEVC